MHETPIRVRWSELDPYGHVNHAVYLTYLEQARIAALQSIGWGMAAIESLGCRVIVARADLRFRRSAGADDALVVTSEIVELRSASSRWHQEIRRGDEVILEAGITGACTDLAGRPRRVPPDLQAALGRLAAPLGPPPERAPGAAASRFRHGETPGSV
ncbi:MAG: acyl-CoA thioesterase [Acidimicrobiia bacterium]|nr:acyl-CoA thioesterase [Acidimicrobiia bacterium]